MRAVLANEDKSLVWSEVPDPVLESEKVIIDIHATAVNRADLLQREGQYPPPPGWPEWMGLEAAGVISAVGEKVSNLKVGDKVCALLGGGGYAEKVAVPSGMVLPIPEGLSMAESSAIPEVFATSYLNLCIEGGMKDGDTVFIQAGASGLGMAAIQLAKAMGAKVVTTVGSEDKAEFVRKLGADVVIDRKKENIAAVMAEHPADIAMDCVAGPGLGACLETMARGGRWVVIATLGGTMTEIDMRKFFKQGTKLIGSTLRSRTPEMKGEIMAGIKSKLWDSFSSGSIRSFIYKSLPISEAEEAQAILQRNENIGKVVLTIQ